MCAAAIFDEHDTPRARALVRRHPLATLAVATATGGIELAHAPCLLDDEGPSPGSLRFHLASGHPLVAAIGAGVELVAIFRGPDGYVSPAWYRDPKSHVPTWNYAIAHVRGHATPMSGRADLVRLLADLSREHEGASPGWALSGMNPALRDELVREITGVRVRIDSVHATFKLSQNREAADAGRVRAALERRGRDADREMAALMASPRPPERT